MDEKNMVLRQFFSKLFIVSTREPAEDGEDEKKMAKITKKGCSAVHRIPVETLLEVLCWIHRTELSLRVSMACRYLRSLAHIRLFEKCTLFPGNNERSLGSVEIRKFDISSPNIVRLDPNATKLYINGRTMNFPDTNYFVPENIVFDRIVISHIDDRALEFLRNISRSFVAIKLHIAGWGLRRQSELLQSILPLCASIQSIRCSLQILCQIQSNFPALLAQCQMLESDGIFYNGMDLEGVLALMLQWFSTGRADGRPKVAYLHGHYKMKHIGLSLIRSLEEKFVEATTPSSFIVRITFYDGFDLNPAKQPLPIQNSRIGEQFALQIEQHDKNVEVLITRCALRMLRPMQQEWDVCKQKLISGGEWFPDERKIHIY